MEDYLTKLLDTTMRITNNPKKTQSHLDDLHSNAKKGRPTVQGEFDITSAKDARLYDLIVVLPRPIRQFSLRKILHVSCGSALTSCYCPFLHLETGTQVQVTLIVKCYLITAFKY